MKNMKRILAVLLAMVLVISLAACGKKNDTPADTKGQTGTKEATQEYKYDITIWAPELAVELTQKQVADFNAKNTDGITLNATIQPVSEADSANTIITDVESGADIYFFAQDQAARLVQSGALSKLGKAAAQSVSAANASGVVAACMSGEDMYAYPLTSDNGYFMYYDKSVIPESDIDSMESLIADCEKAGRTFCFEQQSSGWYLASYFFGTGCVSEWTTADDGQFISVNDTFNSANGLKAAKGIYKLVTSPIHNSTAQTSEFAAAVPAAVVVSGIWDYNTAYDILGENMGVTDLPSFTVDGQTYHLGSYNGCKLIGVKPQADAAKSACIHKLAQYLVSEEAQTERYNALKWGPANINAQNSEEVKKNPGLAALLKQAPYSVPQGQISTSWWDIAKVLGTDIKDSDGSEGALQKALDNYTAAIEALFNMSADEKDAFTVIGKICGTDWNTDFAMQCSAEVGAQNWYSVEPLYLNAGDEFQVRQGKGWDVQFGKVEADGFSSKSNFEVPESGYYFVKLVFNKNDLTGTVSLEKNSYATGWTVIGVLDGSSWDKDFDMTIQEDGTTYKSNDKFEMVEGTEFKVRYAHNWDVSYGDNGANYKVSEAGTYTVVFDSTTGAITLVK